LRHYYDKPLEISEVFQAYYDCRRTKRNSESARKYEVHFEKNLFDLYEKLITKTYQPGISNFFIALKPKVREIWAATFEDRIVHHILYNRTYDRFVNSFIFDTYACIPERGSLKASQRLDSFMRSASNNFQQKCYYLQCDIANFFMAINKNILFNILKRKIQDDWWIWLAKTILFHDPTKNYRRKSPQWKINMIPPNKTLFRTPKDTGLPIGNLSSQFFGNIYLNELDQYTKHELKLKYYIRYADDIVMVNQNMNALNDTFKQMQEYVQKNLLLNFHPQKTIRNYVTNGINFVGYINRPYSKYPRKRTVYNMFEKTLERINNDEYPLETVNSYFGILKHANAYETKEAFIEKFKSKVKFDKYKTKAIKPKK
jgi:hypothetical protein